MKKNTIRVLAIMISAVILAGILALPMISSAEETTGSLNEADYKLESVTFENGALNGKAIHVEGTDTVKRLYVRITFYSENGSTFVTEAFVHDDGAFTSYASGNIVAVAVVLTNMAGTPTKEPGTYSRYDAKGLKIQLQ